MLKTQPTGKGPGVTLGSRALAKTNKFLVPQILDSCARNEISPSIALLKLMSVSRNAADLEAVVQLGMVASATRKSAELLEVFALYKENRTACERAMTMSQPNPITRSMKVKARIASLRESFDRWVEEDAALSVALYTFGNPRLIQKATQEIIDVLNEWELLGPEVDALQIGCGTGRVEELLSPRVRLAWGIDISAKMIGAARQKTAGLANVRFSQCSGREFAAFEADSFNLVYAVDSFPYIVEAGAKLVDRHFAEVARVLRGGSHFAIFNYSYRGDVARDHSEVRRLAAAHGFSVVREGLTPFTIWDGVAYHLQKHRV